MHPGSLNLIGLLDLDADPHGVDARFDQDSCVLVTRNRQRSKEDLGRGLGFDLGELCHLAVWEAKLESVSAVVKLLRTH